MWTLRAFNLVQAQKLTWRQIFGSIGICVDLSGAPDGLIDCVPDNPTELMPPGLCFDAARDLWVYGKESRDIVLRRREVTDAFGERMSWMEAEQATDAAKRAKLWAMELQRTRSEVRVLEAQNMQARHMRLEQLRHRTPAAMSVNPEPKVEDRAAVGKTQRAFLSSLNSPQAFTQAIKAENAKHGLAKLAEVPPSLLSPFEHHEETISLKAETKSKHDATALISGSPLLSPAEVSQPTVQKLPFV